MHLSTEVRRQKWWAHWYEQRRRPYVGIVCLIAGMLLLTLLIISVDELAVPLTNPGTIYLPLIALTTYFWGWRYGALASLLQIACVYILFVAPTATVKPIAPVDAAPFIVLAMCDILILALALMARIRRDDALHNAARVNALNAISPALASELDEGRLLRLIAYTACQITGASVAAFAPRPVEPLGHPMAPTKDKLFHFAAVVGLTPEQEQLFQQTLLGNEELFAPIFLQGVPARVADTREMLRLQQLRDEATSEQQESRTPMGAQTTSHGVASTLALAYAQGDVPPGQPQALALPRRHPEVRSLLGVPLLDRAGEVRGGLLLGHTEPNRFTQESETLLVGLAAQAAVALENARLYHVAQAQAQELNAILDSITDGVTVMDEHGTTRYENRAASSLRAALAELPVNSSLLDPLVREPALRALGGQREANISVHLKDGQNDQLEYLVSATPLHADTADMWTAGINASGTRRYAPPDTEKTSDEQSQTSGAVVVWHDITETRRLFAERQARVTAETQRNLLQTLIEKLPTSAYLVFGQDARLALANASAMELWGARWTIGEPFAAFLQANDVQVLGPNGLPLIPDQLATLRAVQTGMVARHQQEIIRRPDGTTLPILFNAVALKGLSLEALVPQAELRSDAQKEAGAAEHEEQPVVLVVLQDVTALKDAERAKDEFIAIAAHELKTPMAAIKGYAEMLARQEGKEDTADAVDYSAEAREWRHEALMTIDQATSRLVELTDDLLDVARVQAGRLELRVEPHDVIALARRIVKRLQAPTEHHTISIDARDDFAVALLDVRRIEQVLSNLLNNASKYSPEGTPITVSIQQNSIRTLIEISVHDHGIGIPYADQSRIFQRFSRATNAREQSISGSGLGLYLCRELVELHTGRIWFESSIEQGSTFYFTLPIAPDTVE